MADYRIQTHPILDPLTTNRINFKWQGQDFLAIPGEPIASALFANGVRIFGHHHKDGSPQGIFCANGQCAQCMVIANGLPVKACMEPTQPGMIVEPCDGLPVLPKTNEASSYREIEMIYPQVLIIGGGPAGISAAVELGKYGVNVLLVDDKPRLGGKLVLQTHRFFGSTEAVYAGTRGIDIAARLSKELSAYPSVSIWTNTTALAVFSDRKVGILKEGRKYCLVDPQILLVAAGAKEKFLAFPGNSLPGVLGAGAFQTLLNRDQVKLATRIFVVGGGNVGLITAYHALQAGIQVVGLVEALPFVSGYKVHLDKLVRLGVPVFPSHTIQSANGAGKVESITIAQVDQKFQTIQGSEKSFSCDTILVAVGLDPLNEFAMKARDFGMQVYSAGDAEEIAEASAAMFSGKIRGLEIAALLGASTASVSENLFDTMQILKSRPGVTRIESQETGQDGATPVIHCTQEIPCDPCVHLCPQGLILIKGNDIRGIPVLASEHHSCKACMRCVTGCPGLAITLVDYRANRDCPTVTLPFEFSSGEVQPGDCVPVVDTQGNQLACTEIIRIRGLKSGDHTQLLQLKLPAKIASQAAGIRLQKPDAIEPLLRITNDMHLDSEVCRCEKVTASEIQALIRQGCRDINEIKALTRAGMGACGSKTCGNLIIALFKAEGIPPGEINMGTHRPLFVEVPLGAFAGTNEK